MKEWFKNLFSPRMHTSWKSKWVRHSSVVILLFLAGRWALLTIEHDWYVGLLPSQLGVEGVLDVSMTGLMDPCGAVVFRLDDTTAQSLRKQGLGYLKDAHQPRQLDQHPQLVFGDWLPTPYQETGEGMGREDRWSVGLACAELSASMRAAIDEMLRTSGTYVSRDVRSGALLVSPAKHLVVFVVGG